MILFQQLALPVLGLLMAVELYRRLRGRDSGPANLLRLCLWAAAFVAITWPDMLTKIAGTIGIRRGADLVTYIFALAFLGTSFYFYSRYVRLERQLTRVVRHLAVQGARREARERGGSDNMPRGSSNGLD
jgi:hypothetical protein